MMAVVRRLTIVLPFVALGAGVGIVLAGQEVARHCYLSLGLWRTSLWTAARGAYLGALAGAVSAAVLPSLLTLWSPLMRAWARRKRQLAPSERTAPPTVPPVAMRTALFVAVLSAAGAVVIPSRGAPKFGPPYVVVAVCSLALLWVLGTWFAARIASRFGHEDLPRQWFRFRWLSVLSLVWVVAMFHVWNRVAEWQTLGVLALCALTVCSAAYLWLAGPARILHDRIGSPVGTALMGRPGQVLSATALAASLVLCGASWLVKSSAHREASAAGRNVIVIALDTVRADHTTLAAADERDRDLTPNLRELLAERATLFSNAISQAPWTLPAFASIFTGLYPAEHGADQFWYVLSAPQLTLAEVLREAGYRTIGVSSGGYVTKAAGLGQGFEVFDESQVGGKRNISSVGVTDTALRFLRAHGDEPFFAFIHYFDPHWAYCDHSEHDLADGYRGWLRDLDEDMTLDEFQEYAAAVRPRPRRRLLDPEEIQYLRDLYDEEIKFTDTEIGRLLGYLRQAGLEENSLIVLVSDHGEEFLERGALGHAQSVYEELIWVPLAIAEPGRQTGSVIARPVETRALFTTILDFLGLPTPDGRAFPASLLSNDPAESTVVRSATYTMVSGERGRAFARPVNVWWTCLRDERWKLIKEHLRGRALLYDLENDPGETRECSAEHPEERKRLERHLDRLDTEAQRGAPTRPVPEADEAQRRRLRSLGYL